MSKLSRAIKDDPVMQAIAAQAEAPDETGPAVRDLNGFFDPCRYRPEFFCAYATMLLLENLVDASGRIGISELARQMPPAIMSVVLPQLRAFGFIDNNQEPGVVRVLKMPTTKPRAPSPTTVLLDNLVDASGRVGVSEIITESPEDSIIKRLDAEAQE